MPAVGATRNSLSVPSIGQMLSAFPKVLVGLAAVLSGVANACGSALRSSDQHGGGLQTKANDRWENHVAPHMRACLSKPWVSQVLPDRAIIECLVQGIAKWEKESGDSYAAEVVSRSVNYRKLGSSHPAPDLAGPTPRALKHFMRKVDKVVRSTNEYKNIMERTDILLWSNSSEYLSIPAGSARFTADRLIKFLEVNEAVDSFKEAAALLSYRLNELHKSQGEWLYSLNPELMRSRADLAAFEEKVDHNYVAPDASMSNHQLRVLLSRLASHLNEKSPHWVS